MSCRSVWVSGGSSRGVLSRLENSWLRRIKPCTNRKEGEGDFDLLRARPCDVAAIPAIPAEEASVAVEISASTSSCAPSKRVNDCRWRLEMFAP
jgi:hypothetical protein